jgi:uncharacterized protein YPO0396
MKSVSSLTDFVREQMLERTDVKEQVSALLKRFDDLNKAHTAVVNSREQFHILKPLTESSVEYGKTSKEIKNIEAMLEVIPAWFALQKQQLLTKAIEEKNEALTKKKDYDDYERLARQCGLETVTSEPEFHNNINKAKTISSCLSSTSLMIHASTDVRFFLLSLYCLSALFQ